MLKFAVSACIAILGAHHTCLLIINSNACLLHIFEYLHTAWTKLGFIHVYLNCANVSGHCSLCSTIDCITPICPLITHSNACLLQISAYLHNAWTKLGFTHSDLNCASVSGHGSLCSTPDCSTPICLLITHSNVCLLQIFGYLHTAWTEIGFTHGDLNCANVMEHRGDADLYLPPGFTKNDENQVFKLPGKHLQHSFAKFIMVLFISYMPPGMGPDSH